MNSRNKSNGAKIIIIFALLLVVAVVVFIGIGDKKIFKPKNPYEDVDETQYGEINEDVEDEFTGSGDLSEDQVIDSNKITYLRKNIPTLKSSMLVPQGWDIKEYDSNILITPPKGSPLEKIQVSMYIEDSQGKRDPNDLIDVFKPYKENGFMYLNQSYRLVPEGYSSKNIDVQYDKNTFAYIHKGREGKFEQLPKIPNGLDEKDFIKQYRFVGVVEDGEMRVKDLSNSEVTGQILVKFFHTLTGNQKSVIMSFATPKNFEIEMHEIARVMSYSFKDEDIAPANKSDAYATNTPKQMGGFKFNVPDKFNSEILTDKSYRAKAYKDIFDKSFGIDVFLQSVNPTDDAGENGKLSLASSDVRMFIENTVHQYLYNDNRSLVTAGNESMFEMITTSHREVSYDGVNGVEYAFYVIPNNNPAYKISNLYRQVPANIIVTLIPYKNEYLISMVTYDSSNYELAKIYNNAILKSLKNMNK